MTKNNKIIILYEIESIQSSRRKNGYVEVLMSPIDKWNEKEKDDLSIKITGIGPGGDMLPPEMLKQMNQLIKDALPPHMRQRHEKDPRTFLHAEPKSDFIKRGWTCGHTISVTIENVDDDNIDDKKS